MKSKESKEILVREKVKTVSFAAESRTLAKKVKAVLGYKVMHDVIHRRTPLVKLLTRLDIVPFTQASVVAYMEWATAQARKKLKETGHSINQYNVRWETIALRNYKKPIPEFVLHKALQIKQQNLQDKAEPLVRLFVQELNVSAYPDPFLVAEMDEERYYVEVWDEPKFENQLLDNVFGALADNPFTDEEYDDEDDEEASDADMY